MLNNVKDHLRGVEARSEDVKNAILDDIRVIASNSLDRDTWTTVLALFKTKWETSEFEDEELPRRIKVFLAYFFESWVFDADKSNWWQGMNPHHKVNNCALEGVNSVIKRLYTQREKLGLEHLVEEMSRFLVDHLRESKRDLKQQHKEDKLLEAARVLQEQRNLALSNGLAPKPTKPVVIPTKPVIRSRDQGR